MKRMFLRLAILAFGLLSIARPASAIVNGQLDDFEDGTSMNWAGYMLSVHTGGPAGAGDHYLELIADGGGSGGRLTTFNLQQWLGNYIAQGVTAIEFDLRNQSAVTLSIRLAFKSQNMMNAPGYLCPRQSYSLSAAAGSIFRFRSGQRT